MQIVNHDQSNIFHSPQFGFNLLGSNTGGIINIHRQPTQNPSTGCQPHPVVTGQKSAPQFVGIDQCFRGEQSGCNLFFRHFQGKNRHFPVTVSGNMRCDIHRKGRFSHTRTGCNQNQVRPIQAGHNRIQVLKSGASTNIFFFVRTCNLSNVVISTTNCIPDFYHALCIFPLPNLKNTLLRCIQQHLCTLFPCLDVL